MPTRTARPRLLTARVVLWRARRVLVATGVLLVAFALVRTAAPPPPATRAVVVAARDVPAGQTLERADLRVRRVPTDLGPDTAVADPDTLLERRTAVDIPRGLPVVEATLQGERFGVDPPPGTVVVAVSVSAASAGSMLRPGDLVDLVTPAAAPAWGELSDGSTTGSTPALLARRALVVEVGTSLDETASGPDLLDAQDAADLTALVAVSAEEGRVLAAAAAWGPLGTVLVG